MEKVIRLLLNKESNSVMKIRISIRWREMSESLKKSVLEGNTENFVGKKADFCGRKSQNFARKTQMNQIMLKRRILGRKT